MKKDSNDAVMIIGGAHPCSPGTAGVLRVHRVARRSTASHKTTVLVIISLWEDLGPFWNSVGLFGELMVIYATSFFILGQFWSFETILCKLLTFYANLRGAEFFMMRILASHAENMPKSKNQRDAYPQT